MVHGKLFELKAHEILLEGGKFKALNSYQRVVATVKVVSVQEVSQEGEKWPEETRLHSW